MPDSSTVLFAVEIQRSLLCTARAPPWWLGRPENVLTKTKSKRVEHASTSTLDDSLTLSCVLSFAPAHPLFQVLSAADSAGLLFADKV